MNLFGDKENKQNKDYIINLNIVIKNLKTHKNRI